MESGIAMGYIDDEIKYCPYCGARLWGVNLYTETVCEECGSEFCVIGQRGERNE